MLGARLLVSLILFVTGCSSMSNMERHDKFIVGCMEGMLHYVNMNGHIYKPRQNENVEQYEVTYAEDYCVKIFNIKYEQQPRTTKEISRTKD